MKSMFVFLVVLNKEKFYRSGFAHWRSVFYCPAGVATGLTLSSVDSWTCDGGPEDEPWRSRSSDPIAMNPLDGSGSPGHEEAADGGDSRCSWSRFSSWLECACVVTFDLELGQAIEVRCVSLASLASFITRIIDEIKLDWPDCFMNTGIIQPTLLDQIHTVFIVIMTGLPNSVQKTDCFPKLSAFSRNKAPRNLI